MKKLTDKQERFCLEYVLDFNATRAAIKSGYSEKTATSIGSENLFKPDIQERLQELQEKTIEKLGLTKEGVIKDLFLAREISLGIKPHHVIVKDGQGGGVSVTTSEELKKTDVNAFIKINDMLMKHLGMFEKDNEQKKVEVSVDLGSLSTEELLQRAKASQEISE
jgi:phage terminase small subunit